MRGQKAVGSIVSIDTYELLDRVSFIYEVVYASTCTCSVFLSNYHIFSSGTHNFKY